MLKVKQKIKSLNEKSDFNLSNNLIQDGTTSNLTILQEENALTDKSAKSFINIV
jgi:hypothetical protein